MCINKKISAIFFDSCRHSLYIESLIKYNLSLCVTFLKILLLDNDLKDHVMTYSEPAFINSNVNYFWSIKNSSEVIEKLRLRNFQGSQVSSFDFSTLYTSLPHDLIKATVLSLVNWCFNTESKS